MDIHKAELHASGFRALLEVAHSEFGPKVVGEILSSLGTTEQELSDPTAWFSLECAESFMSEMVRHAKTPAVLDRAIRLALSPRHLGIVYPIFRSFGSPGLFYSALARLLPRVNKVARLTVDSAEGRQAVISVQPVDGAPRERTPYFCQVRRTQLAEAARIFELPPAQVDHPQCMLRGDPTCQYVVNWQRRSRRIVSTVGLLAGVAAGIGLGRITEGGPSIVGAGIGLALGGWGLGRVVELRRDLTRRLQNLQALHEGLSSSAIANEQRYAELLEAKADVDAKVEQRTKELRLASERLAATLKQVQELDQAKTSFFSNVSHELRTPLTLIVSPLAELAAGREPAGGTPKAIEAMHRNAARLLQLINQLLDLAKVDAGKVTLARVPTEPLELARNVAAGFSAAAAAKKLALSIDGPALPPVPMDTAWMETALTNLVANALKFTKTKISIRVGEAEGVVRFEVEDDGPGIAPGDLGKVFERFEQGSDAASRKGGTGLGLAMTREAARLHGGDATVRSTPGQTTIFTLTIPRPPSPGPLPALLGEERATPSPGPLPAPPPSPVSLPAPPAAPAADELARPGPDPAAPLCVVVEDDDDLRAFIADVLAAEYRVRAARDGAEGLALIEALRPDAVVSDVSMPRMDGYELVRRLRDKPELRSLPVLLLTARRDVARVLEGFEVGADDYLTKPFHARELLARLRVHVQLRRMVSQLAHQERLASLGVLAASLAHEIKNPLAAITAGIPAIERKVAAASDPRVKEVFEGTVFSARRIEKLVNDLMDLSRVDRNGIERFKPAAALQSAIRLIGARDADGSNPIYVDADIDPDVELLGKPGDLAHVFLNLIDNATRATPKGGKVRVRSGRKDGRYVLEVADSGPGVDPRNLDAIFRPFFTTRPAGQGTGLGLAIARQVALQHGGDITVGRAGDLGGALFTVTLPLARADA